MKVESWHDLPVTLKRANETLKAAASFFAAEFDRPHTRSCIAAGGALDDASDLAVAHDRDWPAATAPHLNLRDVPLMKRRVGRLTRLGTVVHL